MAWDADITNDKINRKNKNKKSDNKESYYENQQNKECEIDPTGGASENKYKYCDLDIPFGFQDIDPMLITVLGEVIGSILSIIGIVILITIYIIERRRIKKLLNVE